MHLFFPSTCTVGDPFGSKHMKFRKNGILSSKKNLNAIFPRTIKHRSDICLHVGVLPLTSPELQCVVSSFELFGNFPPDTLCQCHRHLNTSWPCQLFGRSTQLLYTAALLCSPPCAQLCSIDGSNSCVWKYQVGTMIAS